MSKLAEVLDAILSVLEARFGAGEEIKDKLLSNGKIGLKRPCGDITLVADVRKERRHYPATVEIDVPYLVLFLSEEAARNGCAEEGKIFVDDCHSATTVSKGNRPWPPIARFFVSVLLSNGRKELLYKKP